ncbi:MAG: DNA topoisomerase VI subunit B [Candidatus Aenigmarchaeota archaeon]|nr:DNA topoisomerase VI subunit B [Candidatus Aenigmarchaeota archaeon]
MAEVQQKEAQKNGEGEAVKKIAEAREISVSEFFEKNRHLLGYDNKIKALLMIVKEAVDNSLDACEEARIIPDIYVKIEELDKEKYKITVRDNGPGITKQQIPKIFGTLLYGSKFHRLRQSLTADEPIMVLAGGKMRILPIGEFVDSYLSAGQEEIDVSSLDILVPAFDWKEYRYAFRKVSHLIRHRRGNEVLRIRTTSNREIKVTGCHSLFTYDKGSKRVKEAEARSLKVGDALVIPKRLPSGGGIREINVLDYMEWRDFRKKGLYVHGISKAVFDMLLSKAQRIHKKVDKSRAFFRFCRNGETLDVSEDCLRFCVNGGYLPLYLVLFAGLGNHVKDCVIRTYCHGKITGMQVIWELTPSFMRFLGLFAAEGHVDVRQIGFTFGKHEDIYLEEIARTARTLGANITVEQRESSIRLKVFGSLLPYLMGRWCGKGAKNKKAPEFVFRTSCELRQHFLDALHQGDGHLVKGRNCLMLNTISRSLANDVMYLWSMQGIIASLQTRAGKGLGRNPYFGYVVCVYGDNINRSHIFRTAKPIEPGRVQNHLAMLSALWSDLAFASIKEIEIINSGHDYVYDISVPGCENFVGGTGGIACHNSRGQQGLGISVAVLYSQLTTGMPTEIVSSTGDRQVHKYTLKIEVKKNAPVILSEETANGDGWHGVEVRFISEGIYREHKQSVLEYLKETAIANPYANVTYESPNGRVEFKRASATLPKEPKEIKPHLYGVEVGILARMLHDTKARSVKAFFVTEFTRVGGKSASDICQKAGVDERTGPRNLTDEQIVSLVKAVKEVKLSRPPTDVLSPLGDKLVQEGLKKELNPDFVTSVSRPPAVYRGWPFQIEVGMAYGGSINEPRIIRLANRVPLLYQAGDCAIIKSIQELDWKRYGIEAENIPTEPIAIFVHIASVWVPFTSESKEAVANYPIIIKEIKLALQEAARKLSLYLSGVRRAELQAERKSIFERYAEETGKSLAELTKESADKIIGNLKKLVSSSVGMIEAIEEDEDQGEGEASATENSGEE